MLVFRPTDAALIGRFVVEVDDLRDDCVLRAGLADLREDDELRDLKKIKT